MPLTAMTPLPTPDAERMEEALSETRELLDDGLSTVSKIQEMLKARVDDRVYAELIKRNFLLEKDGVVSLTENGDRTAIQVLRRKRLAERLLKDVLNLSETEIDAAACQWEHVLSREVTNSICTLLGHPTHSPTEKAIPPGECCRREAKEVAPVLSSLADFRRGDRGKIAYLLLKNRPEVQRLLSMGLVPGSTLVVLERVPTFVVQIEETQLAFDNSIAEAVFVHPI